VVGGAVAWADHQSVCRLVVGGGQELAVVGGAEEGTFAIAEASPS